MEQQPVMINKLLENQYKTMFSKFDVDDKECLTLEQFNKFLYSIGMNFIISEYNSGMGELFKTEEYPDKMEVTFEQFMRFIN